MTTHTVVELLEKRNELAGQIIQLDKQVRQYRADLASIESAIRVMLPGIDFPKIVPRRVEFRRRYFKRGELTRLCLDFLRYHADKPITVADIMPVAVGDRKFNQKELHRLSMTVYQALYKLALRGIVERSNDGIARSREGHREASWQIVRS